MSSFKTFLKSDIQEGQVMRVDVNDKSVVLTNIQGKFYVMDSVCSHEEGPLEEGTLEGYDHPWHQGIFDVRTAKVSPKTDWVTDLKSYAVIVNDKSGEISINTD
jgi:nitrite reductase/ring-hydroxylating ferredoxin subunit